MKVVAYTRVSTSLQDGEHQLESIHKYAEKEKHTIISHFSDIISGASETIEREGFRKLIDFIKKNKCDGIIVFELSRLGRNQLDTLNTIKYLKDLHQNIIVVNEKITMISNEENAKDNIHVSLLTAFSQMERQNLKDRIKSGILSAQKAGLWHGSKAINYGYVVENQLLKIDSEQSKVILKIFELYLNGLGSTLIAKYLDENNIPTRSKINGKNYMAKGVMRNHYLTKWHDATILGILQNRIYIGFKKAGENEIFDADLKIIETDIFNEVQKKLGIKKAGAKPKHEYMLKNIPIKCGVCNRNFYTNVSAANNTHQYTCASQRVRERCGNTSFGIKKLENAVWFTLLQTQILFNIYNEVQKSDDIELKISELNEELKTNLKKLKIKDNENTEVARMLLKKYIDIEKADLFFSEIKTEMSLLNNEIKKITLKIEDLQEQIKNRISYDEAILKIKSEPLLAREYLNKIIEKIIVHPCKFEQPLHKMKEKLHFGNTFKFIEVFLKVYDFRISFVLANRNDSIYLTDNYDAETKLITKYFEHRWKKISINFESLKQQINGANEILNIIDKL